MSARYEGKVTTARAGFLHVVILPGHLVLSQPCPQGALTLTWALVQAPVVLSQNMPSFFSCPPFLFFNKLN